jgi:hypothetical protein
MEDQDRGELEKDLSELEISPLSDDELDDVAGGVTDGQCITGATGICGTTGVTGATAICDEAPQDS